MICSMSVDVRRQMAERGLTAGVRWAFPEAWQASVLRSQYRIARRYGGCDAYNARRLIVAALIVSGAEVAS